jgi:hypothetical protein
VLIGLTYYGDTNLDGMVNVFDLANWANHWQQPGGWADGDFNYDGIVNVMDLSFLAGNWQRGAPVVFPPTLVPEPASLLVALASLCITTFRPRRRIA